MIKTMKFSIVIKLCIIAILVSKTTILFGQDTNNQKKEINLTDFKALDISGLAQVYIKQGTENKVDMKVSGVAIKKIKVFVDNETLFIDTPRSISGESIKITVTYKKIVDIKVKDAAELTALNTIKGDVLKITVTQASGTAISVDLKHLEISMKNNADLKIKGITDNQRVKSASSGGTFDNSGLTIRD